MKIWFKPQASQPSQSRRFADLRAMTPQQRCAAITGADAASWIEAAANYGIVEAQLLFGQGHLHADPVLALLWFRAAASAGYAPALNMVGRCLEKGWGVAATPADAAHYYRMAADRGDDWGQFNLANMLLYGLGVPRDRRAAYGWYVRAARQQHAKSMNMIGRFHEQGWDCPCHMDTAMQWYRRAAAAGDYRGQFNLGTLLSQRGETKEARALIQSALAAGDPDFLDEATAVLRRSQDPALQALSRAVSRKTAQTRSPGRATPLAAPSWSNTRPPG